MKDETNGEQFMNKWLQQMNFPYVSIQLKQNAANGKSKVTFNQDRFLIVEMEEDFEPEYVSPFK